MLISNLAFLLAAFIDQRASLKAVEDFSLKDAKKGDAFFALNELEANMAANYGAFVIISEKKIEKKEKDIYYFLVPSLKEAIFKLLKFISSQKKLVFLKASLKCQLLAPAFGMLTLKNDIFKDFLNIKNASFKSIFISTNYEYLANFASVYEEKKARLSLITKKTFSFSLSFDGLFYELFLPPFFAQSFANILFFFKELDLDLAYKAQKLQLFSIYFVDNKNEINIEGSKAFLLASEPVFSLLAQNMPNLKIANRDFFYKDLKELKNFYNFKYALLNEDEELFKSCFSKKILKASSLF